MNSLLLICHNYMQFFDLEFFFSFTDLCAMQQTAVSKPHVFMRPKYTGTNIKWAVTAAP